MQLLRKLVKINWLKSGEKKLSLPYLLLLFLPWTKRHWYLHINCNWREIIRKSLTRANGISNYQFVGCMNCNAACIITKCFSFIFSRCARPSGMCLQFNEFIKINWKSTKSYISVTQTFLLAKITHLYFSPIE